jgi:hypothetical protein
MILPRCPKVFNRLLGHIFEDSCEPSNVYLTSEIGVSWIDISKRSRCSRPPGGKFKCEVDFELDITI